jgi:hypothetical protein
MQLIEKGKINDQAVEDKQDCWDQPAGDCSEDGRGRPWRHEAVSFKVGWWILERSG